MKKFVVCLILIATCLLGCQQKKATLNNTVTDFQSTSTIEHDASQSSQGLLVFHTQADLENNLETQRSIYKHFINYNTIKEYGNFVRFVSSTGTSPRVGYSYFIEDENGFCCDFHIVHGTTIGLDMGILEADDNPADLRFHKNNSGYYYVGNVRYAYYEGKLYNIRWNIDDRTLLIQRYDDALHTYPMGGDTFMSRLLNAETAEAAVAEFNAKVAQARQDAQLEKAD